MITEQIARKRHSDYDELGPEEQKQALKHAKEHVGVMAHAIALVGAGLLPAAAHAGSLAMII